MSKEAAWLLQELPALVERGVLDSAAAARLRAHYAQVAAAQGPGWGMILLAIGGAVLIGLGVILIFAHNWESWTPELRVACSLAPLLLGQLAVWRALRNGSRLWGEGAGVFTALAIGASIALIAQTYQFGGDLPAFLLSWTLLALPLVYLLDASGVAALCWLGALAWALASAEGWWGGGDSVQQALRLPEFLLLAALPLPHLLKHIRANRAGARVAWLLRVALLVLALGYAVAMPHAQFECLLFAYAGMAAAAVLAGRLYFSGAQGLWGNPLFGTGMLGVCAIALIGTMKDVWRHIAVSLDGTLVLPLALALLAVWLARESLRREAPLLPVVIAALTPVVLVLAAFDSSSAAFAALLGHFYLLALVAALIRTGLRETRLGLANLGVALLAALVLLRFFDSDLSYVVRGVGFIVTGAGFFGAIVWLRRRLRGSAP